MKSLVIAEKPSVARDIARVLHCNQKGNGILEGKEYVVTWALGHLVTLADPEEYDKKYVKWDMETLPMMPEKMKLVVIRQTSKQYQAVKTQLFRKDIGDIIIATDAGREGELVARWILDKSGCRKPIRRLWISSVTDKAIRDGFHNLKDGREYDNLYRAAVARAEADWLVGINGTRALTCRHNAQLSCGRVQTPTLAIIARREEEIRKFQPEEYYGVTLQAGGIQWTWKDTRSGSYRTFQKDRAEDIRKNISDGVLEITSVAKKPKKTYAPGLYDLTTLQREANQKYGFSAKETLNIMQRLYENHKVLTYPRTDSRYIGKDVVPTIKERLKACGTGPYRKLAGVLISKPIQTNGSFVDDKKVSDHHAIIPTVNVADAEFGELPSGEQKVLSLITARLLSALGDPAVRNEVDVEFTCADTVFRAKAKNIREKGWREIQEWIMGGSAESTDSENDKKEKGENADMLACIATLTNGKSYPLQNPKMEEGKTTPKKHFTEDSLLSAMERAGADEMPDEVERKGIGTSATRAATIEKLVRIGFVERKGNKKTKYLLPTHKGVALITVMPEQIQSPSMTAEWEQKLLDVEKGAFRDTEFMEKIEGMITELVRTYKIIEDAEVLMHPVLEEIGTCPCCGRHVVERQKGYSCENRQCNFVLWKQNRFFEALGKKMTKPVAVKLLSDGKVALKGCKSKKTGKTYDTTVMMTVDENQRAVFELNFEKGAGKYGKGKKQKD